MPSSWPGAAARRPSCRLAPRPCTMIAQMSDAGVPRTSHAGAVPPSTLDLHLLGGQADGGGIRVGGTAPPAAARGA